MDLLDSVTAIPGIGSIMASKLQKLGINTIFDLLYHIPFRYEDRSETTQISQVQLGEVITLIVTLDKIENKYTSRGKVIQTATVSDKTGSMPVIWFNQAFLIKSFKPGQKLLLQGKVGVFNHKRTLVSPKYDDPETNKLIPIYPQTSGLTSKWIRNKVLPILEKLPQEILPHTPEGFYSWLQALQQVHFPDSLDKTEQAKKRLAFDELLLLQMAGLIHRQKWARTKLTHPFFVDQDKVLQFINTLPFTLTNSQSQAIKEILADLARTKPMNRLLEGDVGSGKTVVAAVAAYIASLNGFKTLVLAPTQILATQHFNTLNSLFKPLNIDVAIVTASKKSVLPSSQIIVGTQALLSKTLKLDKVGLVVIDEQHRFGVAQRSLAGQKGISPHILCMTATPIPRTIALTTYGDLDLSVLSTMPSGRLPVKTWVTPETKRESANKWITTQLQTSPGQAFWVCPFIEESESLTSVKAVKTEFEKLKLTFPKFKLGLLHGKMKSAEKERVLADFKKGQYDILVSTPVVEVGIDIPNAILIVVEAAERFGLAALHQLRGRVGRGLQQSYCLLFTNSDSDRLKALEKHHQGMDLAEIDFKLRGPGQIYGTSQHGHIGFRVATYDNLDLIEPAKKLATELLPGLPKYEALRKLVEKDKITLVNPN